MRRQLGVSRRDLLRRGAVVGGTLLWTVPVISTISRAHEKPAGSPAFVCCECYAPRIGNQPRFKCQPSSFDTKEQCRAACRADGYRSSKFHISPTAMTCNSTEGCSAH